MSRYSKRADESGRTLFVVEHEVIAALDEAQVALLCSAISSAKAVYFVARGGNVHFTLAV